MKRKFLILSAVMMLLTGCDGPINEYNEPAIGVISNKEYTSAYSSIYMVPVSIGKVMTMQPRTMYHDAEYKVTINIENMSTTINDETLYNQYKIGDPIDMNIHYEEYKDGSIKKSISVR